MRCLSTCEAIYYFYKEYDIAQNLHTDQNYQYDGKYDNLLFYYIMQFKMIERERIEPHQKKLEANTNGQSDAKEVQEEEKEQVTAE